MKTSLTYVDLFCGAGGLSLGLELAGFSTVFASDSDAHACETYRRNFRAPVYEGPAGKLTARNIRAEAGIVNQQLALVCGGPPCQGFSVQRRGARQDDRNDLVLTFARLALSLDPKMILIENVPGLLGKRGESEFRKLVSLLASGGFDYASAVLDAADFGVPQRRRRAIIVGWNSLHVRGFRFPSPFCGQSNLRTVRQTIGDLPDPPHDHSEHPAYANHTRVRISPLNERRISHVPSGGGRADIPPDLQLPCHRNDNGHRHLDVYGRMEWDKPAPTITAMFDNFTRGRFAHPEQNRSITAREGARLQSFPDSFRFYGPKKDVARQIGNAVPPLLAKAVGEALIKAINDEPDWSAVYESTQMALPLLPRRG